MTTERTAKCGIYEDRPKVCREYPKIDHYRPKECKFYFIGNDRLGSCDCGKGACCAIPRQDGVPGGAPLPKVGGGKPCKHLVYEEKEKTASVAPLSRQEQIDSALERDE